MKTIIRTRRKHPNYIPDPEIFGKTQYLYSFRKKNADIIILKDYWRDGVDWYELYVDSDTPRFLTLKEAEDYLRKLWKCNKITEELK